MAALLAELGTTAEETRREEIVSELAGQNGEIAREALVRLYRTEPFSEARLYVVQSLPAIDTPDLQPALSLLADAVLPARPAELRSAAVDALSDLNDPRTLPIWRGLKNDRSPEIAEEAAVMIEYLEPLLPGRSPR